MASFGHLALPLILGLELRLDKISIATMMFFALLPDVDVLISFALTGSFFQLHRGLTHSLLFATLPLAIYLISKRREFFWGFIGALSHPLIDLFDGGGIMLFWPITNGGFSFNFWPSASISKISLQGLLVPQNFLSDKLLALILIVYLAYYFFLRKRGGLDDAVKRRHKKMPEKRKNKG